MMIGLDLRLEQRIEEPHSPIDNPALTVQAESREGRMSEAIARNSALSHVEKMAEVGRHTIVGDGKDVLYGGVVPAPQTAKGVVEGMAPHVFCMAQLYRSLAYCPVRPFLSQFHFCGRLYYVGPGRHKRHGGLFLCPA